MSRGNVTLQELKQVGAIAGGFKMVPLAGVKTITLDQFEKMNESQQARFPGVVVLPGTVWIATHAGESPLTADNVYCYNGKHFGSWRKYRGNFFVMSYDESEKKLVTMGVHSLTKQSMEVKKMSEFDLNLDDITAGGTTPIQGFDQGANGEAMSDAKRRAMEADAKVTAIQQKTAGVNLVNNQQAVLNNQMKGRLLGFITKTDDVIKVGLKGVPKYDAQGNPVLKPDIDPEKRAKIQAGEATPAKSDIEQRKDYAFTHTKPGKPVGMIITTPETSEVSLLALDDVGKFTIDKNNNNMVTRVMDLETGFMYLAANYADSIREDEKLLGAAAAHVTVKHTPKASKDDEGAQTVVSSLNVQGRKLLIPGNYFPAKVFLTAPVKGATAEETAMIKNNFAKALASATKERKKQDGSIVAPEALDPDVLAKVTINDGKVTCAWIDGNAPIDVASYEDGSKIADVRLPLVEKGLSKDGSKDTYKFIYAGMDDKQRGPFANPKYAAIVAAAGLTEEKFQAFVEDMTKATRKSNKAARPTLTAEDYLRAKMSNAIKTDGNTSLAEMAAQLQNMVM